MAASQKTQKLKITAVVFFFFIFSSSNSLSSARLLNGFLSNGLEATEPTFNLALPVLHGFDKPAPEQDPKPQLLPCRHHMVPTKNSHVGILRSPTPRLAGKYGPMILNMLPRGPVPSSGPSKGTNGVKN